MPVQISTPTIVNSSPYIVVILMFYHGTQTCSVKKLWVGVKILLRDESEIMMIRQIILKRCFP